MTIVDGQVLPNQPDQRALSFEFRSPPALDVVVLGVGDIGRDAASARRFRPGETLRFEGHAGRVWQGRVVGLDLSSLGADAELIVDRRAEIPRWSAVERI